MPVEHHEDPFESRLGDALRQAGGTFETDRTTLASGGAVRGRRFLFRRRAAVAGGVAGVALAGVGGALLVPWGDGGTGVSGRDTIAVGSSAASSPTPTATATGPVSGDELLRTLKRLLPEGEVSGEEARGTGSELNPYAHVVFDDGEGGGAVSVGLGRVEPGSATARDMTSCPDKRLVPHDSCTTTRLSDGSVLMLLQGYEYPDRRADTKQWTATLVTTEGHHVLVSEWNAEAEKDAPITRPEPPLSPDELKRIATDAAWRTAVDAIPDPKNTGSDAPPAADGTGVRKTLAGLLPRDMKVVTDGGQETEYAYVVVDDGKGESLVQVNVQPDIRSSDPKLDISEELFGSGAEVLPDGTKMTTKQGPGDDKAPGLVMWTVDTMRTDGMRVVVSAFNSGSQTTAPNRDTPALTMAQLKEIATSEEWEKLL
ncbi:hypothetical protein [Streptomyces poonensis]|uniref:LigA protein n=1 Tax=Streptomyces poonensis TaxID=68255 RepID=A0A918P8P5_9ACTN|nr:hypothetical protein [Streptomyces poonensis]GGY91010.1 hypothetical protein GCM10010365_06770 [Streptomyces poonensis]GLJ87886.1 hypothetical protein GCM10017589_04860 [Streptomyces poonensis]